MNIDEIMQVMREDDRGKTGGWMSSYYWVNIPDKGWICRLTGTRCQSNCMQCVFAAIAWEKELNRKEGKE